MSAEEVARLLSEHPKNVPPSVAAEILGKNITYIYQGLQRKRLPFGTAVQREGNKNWDYNIPTPLFIAYMQGDWIAEIYKKGGEAS